MLREASPTAFVAALDLERSRAFYEGVLELEVVSRDGFALVLRSGGISIRVAQVQSVVHAPYTVLGWNVTDITRTVEGLRARGVIFARYEGMGQDELGIWRSPSGAQVAWFEDPDRNVLSLTQR